MRIVYELLKSKIRLNLGTRLGFPLSLSSPHLSMPSLPRHYSVSIPQSCPPSYSPMSSGLSGSCHLSFPASDGSSLQWGWWRKDALPRQSDLLHSGPRSASCGEFRRLKQYHLSHKGPTPSSFWVKTNKTKYPAPYCFENKVKLLRPQNPPQLGSSLNSH